MQQSNELKRTKARAKRRAKQGSDQYPVIDREKCNPGELQKLMADEMGQYSLVNDPRCGYGVKYTPTDGERMAWALSK